MRKPHFIIALSLCACSVVLTVGQEPETLKVLAAVDEKSRPRLAKRLEEFIAYNRSQEWDKLFKLLDKHNASHYTPERFAKVMSEFGRQDFVPEYAIKDGEEYRILGCVTRSSGSFKGGVVAYLQDGDWFFTTYYLRYDLDGRALPCKP